MNISERELWQRSVSIDAIEDDAARYLDLAGLADELLDPDERERVIAHLAGDPDAAADIAAARAFAGGVQHPPPPAVVARARALVDGGAAQTGDVIAFRPRVAVALAPRAMAQWAVQWGGLAAAVIVAGWLGFTLGMDTVGGLAQFGGSADENFLGELLDPPSGLLRDLTESPRT